jgi:hypothetical protein
MEALGSGRCTALAQKGTTAMVRTPASETKAAATRRLTNEMLKIGTTIDKQRPGPKRLELLRRQASLSDQLETLRSGRT